MKKNLEAADSQNFACVSQGSLLDLKPVKIVVKSENSLWTANCEIEAGNISTDGKKLKATDSADTQNL